jgi:hypothetical protein
MKLEKKHWIIIGIVGVIILVWYFFLRKKKSSTSNYAGVYGSFGNESSYDKNWLTNGFQNFESGYKTPHRGKSAEVAVWANVPYKTESGYVKKCLCKKAPSQNTGEPIFSEKCCGNIQMDKVDPGPGGFGPVNTPKGTR